MAQRKKPMCELSDVLIQQIEQVTEQQIDELILLVSRRFHQLHPEREGFFVTLSQDPQKRDEELKKMIQQIRLPK